MHVYVRCKSHSSYTTSAHLKLIVNELALLKPPVIKPTATATDLAVIICSKSYALYGFTACRCVIAFNKAVLTFALLSPLEEWMCQQSQLLNVVLDDVNWVRHDALLSALQEAIKVKYHLQC